MSLDTCAEKNALEAQMLLPFEDINLSGIKTKVGEALSLIGRSRIFHEYTLHDISHVEKMLESLDWLIPESTKKIMTPADWLLIVLSIYFHDLGMLVTDDEFEARDESSFPDFCKQDLFGGDVGTDYESKVAELGEDKDRFLYQEYIRHHHAARIADWINGKVSPSRGIAHKAAAAVADMLDDLPQTFRSDLALVCASHHLSDLYDTERYRTSHPYGDSDAATANVQYAAFLLRAADLLHITNDRTPSVMFRLISPQDPVSQREWAKQDAVARIRPQKGRDLEGNFSDEATKNTIEVFATFSNSEAFFGLTSYLTYASSQLRKVADWAETAATHFDSDYQFPWRHIDTSEVRTEGFSPRQLSFSLDQAKILDLLTGHTLYNDTSVVLRELAQNALDAARLQTYIDEVDPGEGLVTIEWDSGTRELVVRDNGTGMTAAVIERNLLKAGSSRYQEEDFRKRHPSFSPISRFGIGVLSAFMVADSVQITTCTTEEAQARQLTLRSVHGRYLVRLLDKETDSTAKSISPHGTEVRLRIRRSAKLPDMADTLRRWIVIPRCAVKAIVDGRTVSSIGFDSPKAALTAILSETGVDVSDDPDDLTDRRVKVIEKEYSDIRTAFAVRWSRYFRQWEFLKVGELTAGNRSAHAVGTCVEGIRVEETSAGFKEDGIVSLADARGEEAPKTNVARIGLDSTPERRSMLRRVYRSYLSHITDESTALLCDRGQSMTWAAQEAETLLELLLDGRQNTRSSSDVLSPVELSTLREEIRAQALVLVEQEGKRTLQAAKALDGHERLWTVDSGLVRAAEGILREIPGEGSLHAIASGFSRGAFELPEGVTLVGFRPESMIYRQALESREVATIVIRTDQRRVDLGWDQVGAKPIWINLQQTEASDQRDSFTTIRRSVYVARQKIPIVGEDGEVAVRAHGSFYVLAETALGTWLLDQIDGAADRNSRVMLGQVLTTVVDNFLSRSQRPDDMTALVERMIDSAVFRRLRARDENPLDMDALVGVLEETPLRTFDTWAWHRRVGDSR